MPGLKVPIDISRDAAADAARRELSKAVYAAGRPSLEQRIIRWMVDKIFTALSDAASVVPGGAVGLVALAILVIVVVVVLVRRTGPLRTTATADAPLFAGRPRSAREYRAAADTAAAAGAWGEAVRQRFRAIVRSIEERDILDDRPGRTAAEAATAAAAALPACADRLRAAAQAFDDVAYGGDPGSPHTDAELRELDRAVAAARPSLDPAGDAGALAPLR